MGLKMGEKEKNSTKIVRAIFDKKVDNINIIFLPLSL